jgi:hypothetical protein
MMTRYEEHAGCFTESLREQLRKVKARETAKAKSGGKKARGN